ncbi:MAG: serine/threonine protein kinase [Gemmataceae bacterium]
MRSTLQLIGDYEVLEKIAEGGMGSVFKARHPETGEIVAIKVVSPHLAKNKVLLKRFEQEYHVASTLTHPNIIRALGFGYTGVSPYLVMEFVDGDSLGKLIEEGGELSEPNAIQIIVQVAQGLHKAHKQGLVHRDVKPDNILINSQGAAKLADLGLVKELEADLNLTRTGRGLGTPHFMAPEQFRNAKNADVRCDVYSLGATLYMMVTGELPFKSLSPLDAWMKKVDNKLTPAKELNPNLSERVDWAIRRSMHPDPEKRPSSCQEFIEDLTGQGTQPIPTINVDPQDAWFLRYKDEEGVIHTVKGTIGRLRSTLKEGRLGDISNMRASRTKAGPYEPLRRHPEFRDLVIPATQTQKIPSPNSRNSQQGHSHSTKSSFPSDKQARTRTLQTPPSDPHSVGTVPPKSNEQTPHLNLGTGIPGIPVDTEEGATEWGRIFLFFILTMLTGLIGFFALPHLTNLLK